MASEDAEPADPGHHGILLGADSGRRGTDLPNSVGHHRLCDRGAAPVGRGPRAGCTDSHVRIVLPASPADGQRHQSADLRDFHHPDCQRTDLWCLGVDRGGPVSGLFPQGL